MLKMPETDKDVMARRVEIAAALREIVPGEGVITEEAERRAWATVNKESGVGNESGSGRGGQQSSRENGAESK